MQREKFWEIRAAKYDKLFWAKDDSYLKQIVSVGKFKPTDLVLDVGSGTGNVANAVKPFVKHVIAVDISDAMLARGKWDGISVVRWDVADALFTNNLFDKIMARMIFHHIFDELDRTMVRCLDLLRSGGSLVVAEGVPPSDDDDVVEWFAQMFAHKEHRRVFRSTDMSMLLKKNGFKHVKQYTHITPDFSIKNWLENSGIDLGKQKTIMQMHRKASPKIKKLYEMVFTKDDVIVTTKNIITVAEKE